MSSHEKQIYILDDEVSVRRSLKLLMVSNGFAVETFSSAEEFFSDVRNKAPGCLIMDIHMPGLNGWDTLQKFTETGHNYPVLVITADKDEHFKERALNAGAEGFLQKPFEDHNLLHMVNRVFNKEVVMKQKTQNKDQAGKGSTKNQPNQPEYKDKPTQNLQEEKNAQSKQGQGRSEVAEEDCCS
jgi:FixJ family two-component response regulator